MIYRYLISLQYKFTNDTRVKSQARRAQSQSLGINNIRIVFELTSGTLIIHTLRRLAPRSPMPRQCPVIIFRPVDQNTRSAIKPRSHSGRSLFDRPPRAPNVDGSAPTLDPAESRAPRAVVLNPRVDGRPRVAREKQKKKKNDNASVNLVHSTTSKQNNVEDSRRRCYVNRSFHRQPSSSPTLQKPPTSNSLPIFNIPFYCLLLFLLFFFC